jgi:hypothetical protein
MDPMTRALQVFWILVAVAAGIAIAFLPAAAIARWILTPIDRAAKFREAPARFSIGDFLCLFAAIQIPLTAVFQLTGKETQETYWIFTVLTWIIAPVIWVACARALSKAGVTRSWHRFVFLALIMPLVYYGVIPFCVIGISFFALLFGAHIPIRLTASIWIVLAILFFASGLFVRRMLSKTDREDQPLAELDHQKEPARAAMHDGSDAVSRSIGSNGRSDC